MKTSTKTIAVISCGKTVRNTIFKVVLTVLSSLFFLNASAQFPDSATFIQKEFNSFVIKNVAQSYLPRNFDVENNFNPTTLSKDPFKGYAIPPSKVPMKIIAGFTLINNQDDKDSCYFFPGFFYTNVLLYKYEKGKIISLPVIAPNLKDSISFRLITLQPHDTLQIVAECYLLKTYINYFKPRVIDSEFIEPYIKDLQVADKSASLFTFVFSGLLMLMIIFSLANYLQGSNREFLFYAGYAFFLGFMLFTKQYYYNRSYYKNFFYEAYLDFILQGIGICFFMAFMIGFLETKKRFPFLHKLYRSGIVFLIAVMFLYTYLHYQTDLYNEEFLLENYLTKGLLLIMVIIFLVYAFRHWKYELLRYLFWGHFFFLLFSVISLLRIISPSLLNFPGVWSNGLVWYEAGLFLELFFFLMGLVHKNRTMLVEQVQERERLKIENERKEMEKQMAVLQAHQEERQRISADMHDELGSGMTTIRLMSEIAKNKMKENIPTEIEKISNSANDLLNKMNAIIWSMNSSNDTVGNLVSYIRAYALEYFEGTPIHCNVKIPEVIAESELSGDKRRNIFLCVKETLNNALKHSNATLVEIEIEVNNKLRIRISDNGIGIKDEQNRRSGNGLKNITRRMKTIGGNYSIENSGGTESRIELPL